MRVVVVGAGFAGLIAAWRLAQGGCDVLVLEARDRVGGRVWSQELIPGDPRTVIERGAEFVLDGYDVLRGLLGEVGLDLADTVMSYYERELRGGDAGLRAAGRRLRGLGGRRGGRCPAGHLPRGGGRGLGRSARRTGRLPVPHRDHRWRPRPTCSPPPRPATVTERVQQAAELAGGRGQPAGGPGTGQAARPGGAAGQPGPIGRA